MGPGRGIMGKEGTRQRTCMRGTRTWTMVRELTAGAGDGMGRGGQRGKMVTTVIE